VYDARAVATPWTPAEKEAIKACNREFRQEQQEAARYECRRTMTNVITFEIVRQGLTNPLMRTEAANVAGECIRHHYTQGASSSTKSETNSIWQKTA
jgi:hypothetical protein